MKNNVEIKARSIKTNIAGTGVMDFFKTFMRTEKSEAFYNSLGTEWILVPKDIMEKDDANHYIFEARLAK